MIIISFSAAPTGADATGTRLALTYTPSSQYRSSVYYSNLKELRLTGNQRLDLINVGLSQVGYHEGDKESELDGSNINGTGNVTEYGRWFGYEILQRGSGFYYDWCAMFVAWTSRQSGLPESIINNATYAHIGSNPYYFHMDYHKRGTYTPKAGDLIFYDWASSARDWEHVGIVAFVEDGMVHVVEGNALGKVLTRVVSLDYYEIQGYGTPVYTNADSSAVEVTSYPKPKRNLSQGMEGEDVKWLQAALLHIGYASPIDGYFGKNTRSKLVKFQSAHGLASDGILGPATLNELIRSLPPGSVAADPEPDPGTTQGTGEDDPSIYPVPTRTLRKGMTGNDVKWLQAALNKLGAAIIVDGDFGSGTEAAVKAYQKNNGLTQDGVVGPATRTNIQSALEALAAPPPPVIPYPEPQRVLRKGMKGDDVKWLQEILTQLGYTADVDGNFGSGTEKRVKEFQRANGLTVDGAVGPATVKALKKKLEG
ncbi:MAG: peptidoglycan-binding protein [Clostridia bacterium]|nr:peptidoglycan-binding protein [Clostridia bacterium]